MKYPLISIVIPTCNSEQVLANCLFSIKKQDYPQDRIETTVVDCLSNDNTAQIAKKSGARVLFHKCGPLKARKIGFEMSTGDLILFLDSDQTLKTRDCLRRAVAMSTKYDILHFEEFSLPPTTRLQELMRIDKKITQEVSYDLSPLEGVLYPRFFKRYVLDKAFQAIPSEILASISEHEDVVLHWETYKVSRKIGTVKNAVWHKDPETLLFLLEKMYKYGKTGNIIRGQYDQPVSYKQTFRIKQIIHLLKQPWNAALIVLFLTVKTIPYKLGQIIGYVSKNYLIASEEGKIHEKSIKTFD
jgi:glycosyltransferase involved in cell wall biosynthesis